MRVHLLTATGDKRHSPGEVEVRSRAEAFDLLGIEEEDLDALVLPNGSGFLLSHRAQREQTPEQANPAATVVLRETFGGLNLALWGTVLFAAKDFGALWEVVSDERAHGAT